MTGWTGYELSFTELGPVGAVVRRGAGFVVRELPELALPDVGRAAGNGHHARHASP